MVDSKSSHTANDRLAAFDRGTQAAEMPEVLGSHVLIVIVNYRTADLVIDCLRSLVAEVAALGACHVRITDNASGDGSVERIRGAVDSARWNRWVSVLPLDHNGGFAVGNNAALRTSLRSESVPDLVLLLNPDTLVLPGAIMELVRFMETHPRAGVAGSRVEDVDGRVQCSAHRVHTPLSQLLDGARLRLLSRMFPAYVVSPAVQDEPHTCDWVSGASLMIRRNVFASIGLLDEGYFLYFEEVDFCCRAKREGWEVWHVPMSRVVHLEGESTGNLAPKRRAGYWFDSRRRFFMKQYGIHGLLLADLLWLLGRSSLWVRRLLRLGGSLKAEPKWFTLDLLAGDCHALLSNHLRLKSNPENKYA